MLVLHFKKKKDAYKNYLRGLRVSDLWAIRPTASTAMFGSVASANTMKIFVVSLKIILKHKYQVESNEKFAKIVFCRLAEALLSAKKITFGDIYILPAPYFYCWRYLNRPKPVMYS
jgi:hypothetical protein